ncbi:hypothetical protein GCM10009603_16800 [Nocardiopsis exhalans]
MGAGVWWVQVLAVPARRAIPSMMRSDTPVSAVSSITARFGVRGPAEAFLRRMTYGSPDRKEPEPVSAGAAPRSEK